MLKKLDIKKKIKILLYINESFMNPFRITNWGAKYRSITYSTEKYYV